MLKGKLRSLVKVSVLVLGLTIMATAPVFADDDCDDDMPKLRRGVEAGAAKAQYSLGYCYFLGKSVQQDDSSAVKWFRKSAEQGFARGQGALGWMYEHGRGVPQDYREAVAWYRKAAAQGDARGQGALGRMYEKGRGVPLDEREAEVWYRKAAAQGDERAIRNLASLEAAKDVLKLLESQRPSSGEMCENDFYRQDGENGPRTIPCSKLFEMYKYFAEETVKGMHPGRDGLVVMHNLANNYYHGVKGAPQDYFNAAKWYRKCAEGGFRDCERNLAKMYYGGDGVPKNMHEETVKWARKCAAKGDGDCERILAEMYYEGKGVPKNLQKATEYLRNCANKGVEGCEKLANLATRLEQSEPCKQKCWADELNCQAPCEGLPDNDGTGFILGGEPSSRSKCGGACRAAYWACVRSCE